MKKKIAKLLFGICLSFIAYTAFSQDTTKVEQYCELVATGKMFSKKVSIAVDFGQFQSFWSGPNRIKDEEGKVQNFNSVVDALNYMGKQGWTLVNAFPISEGSGGKVYHFYFKKSMLKSEITDNN